MNFQARSLPQQFNVRAELEGWPAVCDVRMDFEAAPLKAVLAKWRGAARGEAMPRRTAVTTRILGEHLPIVAIVDYLEPKAGPRRYRFRHQGSALARIRGDFSGRFVDEALPNVLAQTWTFAFDTVLQHGAPLRFIAIHNLPGHGRWRAESLVAPLGDAHDVPSSVMTAISYSSLDSDNTHDHARTTSNALAGL